MTDKPTIQEFLNLSEKEQSSLAGKLRPEPWKHNEVNNARGTYTGLVDWCTKCKTGPKYDFEVEAYPFKKTRENWRQVGCSVPTPIPIDFNRAKALQRECDRGEFDIALDTVIECLTLDFEWSEDFTDFVLHDMEPQHIFAALLKMKGILE